MNTLPILPLLFIKDRILVLGEHFLFARHIAVPSVNGLCALAVSLECSGDGIDDPIDCTKTFPLACFLVPGDSPWDFPAMRLAFFPLRSLGLIVGKESDAMGCTYYSTYQSRPEKSDEVGLNIMAGWLTAGLLLEVGVEKDSSSTSAGRVGALKWPITRGCPFGTSLT